MGDTSHPHVNMQCYAVSAHYYTYHDKSCNCLLYHDRHNSVLTLHNITYLHMDVRCHQINVDLSSVTYISLSALMHSCVFQTTFTYVFILLNTSLLPTCVLLEPRPFRCFCYPAEPALLMQTSARCGLFLQVLMVGIQIGI